MIRKTKKVYMRWSLIHMIVPALILAIVFFCGIRFLQYEMKNELVQSYKATAELIDSKMEKALRQVLSLITILYREHGILLA